MNTLEAIVIGFVQGVGEFLPISSSGHLVLMYQLFNIDGNNLILTIFLHIATLFSVIYVYRGQLLKLISHPLCRTNKLLVVASIPTAIIGLLLKKIISGAFESNFVIFGFLITAVILGIADYLSENRFILSQLAVNTTQSRIIAVTTPKITVNKKTIIYDKPLIEKSSDITSINLKYWQALVIGIAQGLACFPGVSRSGSTIATGLILNGDKNEVTTFSFLLSIPVILGSLLLAIFDLRSNPANISSSALIIACVISFLVGIISIALINIVVKRRKLSYFSYYLIALVFVILLIKII